MANNLDNVNTGIGWLERLLQLISKFKIMDFIKAFAVIFMVAITVSFITKPEWIFNKWEEYKEKEHKERMEIVEKNNTIIHTELENILYKTGADRVVLLSYHNSKQSLTGMPYIYLTAINEAIQYNVNPVAEGYESVKVSLYPMIGYLSTNEFFCGDIEEMRDIDKALADRLEGNDVKHLCMLQIEGEYPLGVLVATYTHDLDTHHDCKEIESIIRKSGVKIGVLLSNNKSK